MRAPIDARGAAQIPHAGCFAPVEHERRTTGVHMLVLGAGVTCHAVQFTAGLA